MKVTICPICNSNKTSLNIQDENFYLCSSCDVLFRYPLPEEQDLIRIYQSDYSIDNIKRERTNQAETTKPIAQQLFNLFMGEINGQTNKLKGLELGAGLGTFAEVAKNKVDKYIAVEQDNKAREFISERGINVASNLKEINKEGYFDFIVMIETIEHLIKPIETLRSIYKMLKFNGKLFITTPNHRGLNSLLYREKWREAKKPTHLYLFSPKSLEKMLTIAGFKKIKWIRKAVNYNKTKYFSLRSLVSLVLQITGLTGGLKFVAHKK